MTHSTQNIASLIAQAVSEKQDSEVNLIECPNELLPGRQASKNSALQKYQESFGILRGILAAHAGGIFVTGPGAQSFADIAVDEVPALVLDAAEMYSEVAKVWFPTVRVDKVFAVDCMPAFMMGLNSILFPLGVRRIAPPDFGKRFGSPVTSFEDAVNLTRDILRTTLEDDLNVLYLTHKLTEKVIAAEWDLKFVTVVVLNATLSETHAGRLFNDLLGGRNIEVNTKNETATENEVLIACKHLRAKVTGKTIDPTTTNETDQTETSPSTDDKTKPTRTPRTPRTPRNPTNPQ